MPRTPNTHGGGAKTNQNGLHFEQTNSLDDALRSAGYDIRNYEVYRDSQQIGMSVPKHKLYKEFLEPNKINYKDYNSKKWLPDEAFINFENKTAYIIEKKFQNCAGSVDEKLPNCQFKKHEYEKLFSPLEFNIEFIYIFSDWFRAESYCDALDYIEEVGCQYFYNDIPLEVLGL